ncbi:hypothetical protein ACISK3_14050 [Morganella morganii]|nr:hypothetical protein [Morganella morganii]
MICLSDNSKSLSIKENSFHRNFEKKIDPYDYFDVDISLVSDRFTGCISNVEFYVHEINEMIESLKKIIKNEISEFNLSISCGVFIIKFKKPEEYSSYDAYFEMKPSDGSLFVLQGKLDITNECIVEILNDLKYFIDSYCFVE